MNRCWEEFLPAWCSIHSPKRFRRWPVCMVTQRKIPYRVGRTVHFFEAGCPLSWSGVAQSLLQGWLLVGMYAVYYFTEMHSIHEMLRYLYLSRACPLGFVEVLNEGIDHLRLALRLGFREECGRVCSELQVIVTLLSETVHELSDLLSETAHTFSNLH